MIISELKSEVVYHRVSPVMSNRIRQQFAAYAALYYRGEEDFDAHIRLKLEHTLRVCDEIKKLGEALFMEPEELAFLDVIALLHDIGRFDQFDRYRTFADAESENHARLAIKTIEKLDLLSEFPHNQKQLITESILNHNIPALAPGLPETTEFYSRLLRDADKLDIWRVSLENTIFHTIRKEPLPLEYAVPAELTQCFRESRIILLDQLKSFYDSLLFRLSWIYDLRFTRSFELVIERQLVARLLEKLPGSPELDEIARHAEDYIEKRLRF